MWFNEYERQNLRKAIVSARLEADGRPMPFWGSTSSVNDRGVRSRDSRGPLPKTFLSQPSTQTGNPADEEESEYEEIEQFHNYSNMSSNPGERATAAACALCGNPPLVRCEMCSNQPFCGTCNEIFHRHPKRHNHTRKLLDPLATRPPPLPTKVGPEMESPMTPVPPPRRHKVFGVRSTNASPTPVRSFAFNPVGSLKRFVGPIGSMSQRPLPFPPTHQHHLREQILSQSGNRSNVGVNHSSMDRRQSAPFSQFHGNRGTEVLAQRSGSISHPPTFAEKFKMISQNSCPPTIPTTVMELGNKQRNQNQPKYPDKYCLPPSRDSGWEEEEEETLPRNQRSLSVSAYNLNAFPTSTEDSSHFATFGRRGSSRPQRRPPPPLPPRDFNQYPVTKPLPPSSSDFQLDRGGAFVPWSHSPHQFGHQKTFLPSPDVMRRAPAPVRVTDEWDTSQCDQKVPPHSVNMSKNRGSTGPYGNEPSEIRRNSYSRDSLFKRPSTPQKPPAPPPPPLDPEYYSGEDEEADLESNQEGIDNYTENPIGPWTCEHCTFINPKSTRICTVCCKTPLTGYRSAIRNQQKASRIYSNESRDRMDSNTCTDTEWAPVVKSKLIFSNSKTQGAQPIKLSVEKVRKQGMRPIPTSYEPETDSESASGSESSSEDLITEKHRSLVRENKAIRPKGDGEYKIELASPASSARVGTGKSTKWESKSKSVETADASTGDYSIVQVITSSTGTKVQQAGSPAPTFRPISPKNPPVEQMSSKGTSPPPQTISTQTYEELPAFKMRQQSVSKSSLQSLAQSRESSPPRVVEMSEKALRYARRAQQHTQLKRSMSTQLTSGRPSDSWTGQSSSRQHYHEGRHLYRTSSRQSLASDTRSLPVSGPPSRESSPPPSRSGYKEDFRYFGGFPSWCDEFPTPAHYFASIDNLVARKRRESVKSQELELSRLLKEAEDLNYTPEDVQMGLRMCGGDRNPIKWLEDNWSNMVETVQTLATKYGRDKGKDLNEVGTISMVEGKEALRLHKGNVWAAVTECIEQRRKKSRGNFMREDILTALTANQGNLDAAYVELSKAQLKPFLMRIWGPPSGRDNESAPPPPTQPPPTQEPELKEKISISGRDPQGPLLEKSHESPSQPNEPNPISALTKLVSQEEPTSLPEAPLKSDFEEETFYDLDTAGRIPSLSDGEESEDLEADVSAFIQNYEIPPPPPSPSPAPQTKIIKDENKVVESRFQVGESPRVEPLGSSTGSQSEKDQSIDTLTKAVNAIAHTLGLLLQQQNSTSGLKIYQEEKRLPTQNVTKGNEMRKVEDVVEECNEVGNSTPQSTVATSINSNDSPTEKNETQYGTVTNTHIQAYGLSNETPIRKRTPEPSNSHPKSRSSKIYEVLGNLAGSLLGGGKSKTPKTNSEENVYETVAISSSVPALTLSNEIPESVIEEMAETPYYIHPSKSQLEESPLVPVPLNPEVEDEEPIQNFGENLGQEEEIDDELDSFGNYSKSESEEMLSEESEVEGSYADEDESEMITRRTLDEPPTDVGDSHYTFASVELFSTETPTLEPEEESQDANSGNSRKGDFKSEQQDTKALALVQRGGVDSLKKAKLVLKLMDMNFSEEDSIQAANECSSLYAAISFLQQECLLCAGKFSANQMVSMLRCKHCCCRNCASEYFMVQIRDHSIIEAVCPFCKEPSNLSEEADDACDYFSHLEILIKDLLSSHYYEMFGRKLRDWTLAKTPNFKWCSKCSSGFITEPLQAHLVCPDCGTVTCAICLEPWDKINHSHPDRAHSQVFCDESSDAPLKSVLEYLNEKEVECPRCHLKFSLSRGGCMHLTCSQCRYEFCSGCNAPFAMGLRCKENSPFCAKLGLHAHHPRNCFFYLRDKDPSLLIQLLKESNLKFVGAENAKQSEARNGKCQVLVQKETFEGLEDGICGEPIAKECSEICPSHYVEYLGLLAWEHKLDPIPILTNDDLETIVKRACKKMPPRPYGTTEADYRPLLLKVISEEIPL